MSLRKRIIYAALITTLVTVAGVYRGPIEGYLQGLEWTTVASIVIFLAGLFYAVLERQVIVGVLSVLIAILLPWIKLWAITYWPAIKDMIFH